MTVPSVGPETSGRFYTDPEGNPTTTPMSKLDAAMFDLFGCFDGKEIRVRISVDGKPVGTWTERRQLTQADADALHQTLSGT